MSEMVERVAKAIAKANGYDPSDMAQMELAGVVPVWTLYEHDARAAIGAMRDVLDAALSPLPLTEDQT